MKPIIFTKKFSKHFEKRVAHNKKLSKQFMVRLQLFNSGHRGAPLNDHALNGGMVSFRAFSVTGDVRVIHAEEADAYRFVDTGTHAQAYQP